jgi:folate-dependent phosphoribosylglycinamide formyltransferase PurN
MRRKSVPERARIAIFTSEDMVWAFPTWKNTIPILLEDFDVVGIYVFPDRLANLKGIKIPEWYFNVFGFGTSFLLGIFSFKRQILSFFSSIQNYRQLAHQYGIQLNYAKSPNAEEVIQWTKDNHIDIIIIMVGDILKDPIINAPKIGVINKHASILPSCRGIYPFIWAKILGMQTGFTFHEVNSSIDTGRILFQAQYPTDKTKISMLRFYTDVYTMFPKLLLISIHRLITGEYQQPPKGLTASYYSLPTRQDFMCFRNTGNSIGKISDLFYSPPKKLKEGINEVCSD